VRPAPLRIEADLRLAVTAPDGRSTTAHAVGEGSTLRVETPHPDVLLAAIDRADVGPLADALDAAGVSVSVSGPDGRVAVIGSAASSRLGRLLTGSANTQVPLRLVVPRVSGPAVAMVALAGLVALWWRATRDRRAP
jgi:hypothetical protein